MRLLAIGDIHGQLEALKGLMRQVHPTVADKIVFLGDYLDRGPDSRGVIDYLINFQKKFPETVFLRGNHEQMCLDVLIGFGLAQGVPLRDQSGTYWYSLYQANTTDLQLYLKNGGEKTLKEYGLEVSVDVAGRGPLQSEVEFPADHLEFLQGTKLWHREGEFTFVHAGYDTDCEENIEAQAENPYYLLWDRWRGKGKNGETVVVGHTVVESPETIPGRIRLDTGAGYSGVLSCVEVRTGQVWSVPVEGKE